MGLPEITLGKMSNLRSSGRTGAANTAGPTSATVFMWTTGNRYLVEARMGLKTFSSCVAPAIYAKEDPIRTSTKQGTGVFLR